MNVKLSPLISSGMVLQREADVALWGEADGPVTVSFRGQAWRATPDARGRWRVVLRDLAPGGPEEMRINEHTLHDVYVGDVWLCAGQSNMQLPMRRVRQRYPEAMREENPCIRQFAVPQRCDFSGPQTSLEDGRWAGATVDEIPEFTAAGLFFAKHLYARYGVPIGLIQTAVGGTPIHAWMGRDALAMFPDLLALADRFADPDEAARVERNNAAQAQAFEAAIDATDPGLAGGWRLPDIDDGAWETRALTDPWPGAGSAWLRKTINIPAALMGRPATLFLGTALDADRVYLNGELVGETTYRYPPREYAIPALPAGRATIVIRVVSQSGGGFTPGKPYLLATEAGSIPLRDGWRFCRGGTGAPLPTPVSLYRQPAGLFHGMIAPLISYRIRGAIWYQGEADTGSPTRYAEKFAAMVGQWRRDWGYEFPLIAVELAHWDEGPDWHLLRDEQWKALAVPGTALAAADDLGEHNDLHPLGKRPIGERLARCAMRLAYGERMDPSPFEIIALHEEDLHP